MSLSTCPSEHQLSAFLLGELPERSLHQVAEHLEDCMRCEALAQRLDAQLDPLLAALRSPALLPEANVTRSLGRGQEAAGPPPSLGLAPGPAALLDQQAVASMRGPESTTAKIAGGSTMTCCPGPQRLQAFVLGTIAPAEAPSVQQHLQQCADCQAFIRTLFGSAAVAKLHMAQPFNSNSSSGTDSSWVDMRPNHERPAALGSAGNGPAAAGRSAFSFLLPPEQSDEIGRLGNYRVLRLLGKGGMAYVFHAEDLTLGRPVALKVMKPDLDLGAEGYQRFLREARIMAAIKHEHLVTVYQAGKEGDIVYLAMELLPGESLGDWLDRGYRAEVGTIVRLGREIAGGLAVVHRHGLIHRDVKPDNLWLEALGSQPTPFGTPDKPDTPAVASLAACRIKILDFGLARHADDRARLTQPGTIMGTPAFMSPEQARGDPVDVRGDLFSLGCVLYCLCTGKKPFRDENTMATLTALALDAPRPVRELNPALPAALADLVMHLLEKVPKDRPPSAEMVLVRLQQIEAGLANPAAMPKTNTAVLFTAKLRAKLLPMKKVAALARSWWKLGLAAGLLAMLAFGVLSLLPMLDGPPVHSPVYPPVPRAYYLSDMTEIEAENWPFRAPMPPRPPPKEPPHWPPPKGGRRVSIQDKASLHGIWMHLPPPKGGTVSITYDLRKQFGTIHTEVSLNDGPRKCTPLTFAVYGDGRQLWKSKPVSTQADIQPCTVSVKGVDRLKIEVSGFVEAQGSHAVWIEPYVLK